MRRRPLYNQCVPQFRLLGPLEVAADDGEPLPLGGQKQRAVLAVLLLRCGEVVSTEFLVDALWGEQPPRTATTSLQNCVSALRKLVGPDLLVTRPPGYALVVPGETVDVIRFEGLVADARTLPPEERAAALREALELWRGPPLADLAFEPFAAAEVHRLDELRLTALEEWADAELAAGRHAELVPELEALVERHPLRERVRGQLMLALYHSGRQADALAAYQAARRTLVEELGIEPSPQLQELHGKILRQQVPRPRVADASADDAHFAEVVDALRAGRLVPVLGTDTRPLADHLAQRFDYRGDARDLTRVAQFVALTRGPGPLHDELAELVRGTAAPTAVHRFFAALQRELRERGISHQLLVTTAYDLALEQALLETDEEFDVVFYIPSGRDRGRFCHRDPSGEARVIDLPNTYATELSLERRPIVLRLHGMPEQTGAVVTEDDYIAYLARGDVGSAVPVGLAARLRRSHFLFLGYGIREWNLRLVLDRMSGGDALAYRSWAVLPEAQPLERHFWRARDIDLLEHPLEAYVDALAQYVGVEVAT
jgi:DNA-binding SARP family transcriptional activator